MDLVYEFDAGALKKDLDYAAEQTSHWEKFLRERLPAELPFNMVALYAEWYHERELAKRKLSALPL